jgi:hypothetical protein
VTLEIGSRTPISGDPCPRTFFEERIAWGALMAAVAIY